MDMRALTTAVLAAALLTAVPAMAQAGFHSGLSGADFGFGARHGYYHHAKYRYRLYHAYRRAHRYRTYHGYRRAHPYSPYSGAGGGSAAPDVPSWYGQSSYRSGYLPH